jgi:hypothetical protein
VAGGGAVASRGNGRSGGCSGCNMGDDGIDGIVALEPLYDSQAASTAIVKSQEREGEKRARATSERPVRQPTAPHCACAGWIRGQGFCFWAHVVGPKNQWESAIGN